MHLPSKPVLVLIGVHSVCLAVGYWFLCQLFVSSTEHQAANDIWSKLAVQAAPLAAVAHALDSADPASDLKMQSQLQSLSQSLSAGRQAEVILVNGGWKVASSLSSPESGEWAAGDLVRWKPVTQVNADGSQWGWLTTRAGIRAAVRHPVVSGQAHLFVYDPALPLPPWQVGQQDALSIAAVVSFVWTWVLVSVATYLLSARISSEESDRKAQKEQDAFRSSQELLRTRDAVIFGLAKLAESRDPDTGHHLERISLYSIRLANALRGLPKYKQVTPGFIRLLGISSVLHDIGKVGLEDTVLLKPGRLNAEERRRMQEHTIVAGDCLREIEQRLGESNFLQTAREIAVHHHERWDGSGYPDGLAGEAIPLAARIVAVADVYDALSSKRVYKDAFCHEECVRLIREGAGTQFDPELVEVFLSIESDFAAIAQKFAVAASQAESRAQQAQAPVGPDSGPDSGLMTPAEESILQDVVNMQDVVNSPGPAGELTVPASALN